MNKLLLLLFGSLFLLMSCQSDRVSQVTVEAPRVATVKYAGSFNQYKLTESELDAMLDQGLIDRAEYDRMKSK